MKKTGKNWYEILEDVNWKFLCKKYNEYALNCDRKQLEEEANEYLSKWNELKEAWKKGDSTDRLRLYSSGQGTNVSITYFLEFFNRDKICLGYCKPGLNSQYMKIYRLSTDKELYYVDGGKTKSCDVKTATEAFKKLLEPSLHEFITTPINTEQDLEKLLESNKDFIQYYSPNQFLYKIVMLNTIPKDVNAPISLPMLFTNSHAKINRLLTRLGIKHKFVQRISMDRFKFANAFVMKYWSKLKDFSEIEAETPNIFQTEFMSWVCSRIYSDDDDFDEIDDTKECITNSVNEIDDFKFQQELNQITDYELENEVTVNDEPTKIECSEIRENDLNVVHYKRHRERAINALKLSDFRCEFDRDHATFIKRNSKTRYVECHHLIPMERQGDFDNSLDTEANIVALCSNCHNQIHYGEGTEELLKKLYDDRKKRLKRAGIYVTFDELLKMYKLK